MDKQYFIEWVSELQKTYVRSEQIKAVLSQVDLIAIVGPTGVGKSAIIDKLGFPYVISDVSREKRPNEKEDMSYHFRVDYLEIIKDINDGKYAQFLISKYSEFYGTRIASYPESGPCTMAVIAQVVPLFRELGFRSVEAICVMPPSYVEWMRRITKIRPMDLLGRISEARQSILMAIDDPQYNFVLNDDLDLVVEEIKAILKGEEVDEHRAQLAYDTANTILKRIGDEPEDL